MVPIAVLNPRDRMVGLDPLLARQEAAKVGAKGLAIPLELAVG
jgi:hypothetical protein